ncbi:hypothetical protein HDZ31DRAFT_69961 [Schizophyllum fasciatum]
MEASGMVLDAGGPLRTRLLLEVLLGVCRNAAGAIDASPQPINAKRTVYRALVLRNHASDKSASTDDLDGPSYVDRLLGPEIFAQDLEPLHDEIVGSLDATLDAISRFVSGRDPDAAEDEEARLDRLGSVYDVIKAEYDELQRDKISIRESHERIQQLEAEVAQIHPRLHASLTDALQTLPPVLHAKRQATHDLLATTLETLLIKLSVLRARAQQAVYGPPDRRTALEGAYAALADEGRRLAEEEEAMDRQIREYEAVLRLGGASGFRQIVDDYARVQRDTEECRRDLRRLGWAGE